MSRISLGAALAAAALAALLSGADGQQAALEDRELLGMRLFNQSCRVCHTKPQLTSPLYGPELSQRSLDGQEAVMREVISNGTPRSAGVLATGSTGATELVSGIRGAQLIGVTREPAGGSRTPSQPLVARVSLT